MFVCICKAVTESEVEQHCSQGARCADDIGERCGAGWGCGSCVDRINEILQGRDLARTHAA